MFLGVLRRHGRESETLYSLVQRLRDLPSNGPEAGNRDT